MPCPYCGEVVMEEVGDLRRTYKRQSIDDRARILKAAREDSGWVELATALGIPQSTAEEWVRSDEDSPKSKGGSKPKKITEDISSTIISALEEDSQLTLKQIQKKIIANHQIRISEATISRSIHGMAFTVKKVHNMPAEMNLLANKLKRRQYVLDLQVFMGQSE